MSLFRFMKIPMLRLLPATPYHRVSSEYFHQNIQWNFIKGIDLIIYPEYLLLRFHQFAGGNPLKLRFKVLSILINITPFRPIHSMVLSVAIFLP